MYVENPFNYTGSKYKILDQILPLFDYNKKNFVDLFAGGGSVYSNVLDKYDKIAVNDVIKELIDIQHKLIINDDIINNVKKLVVSKDDKDGFLELRKNFNNDKSPEKLWALMLCCTNNMLRFNKKFEFNQTFGKRTFNSNTEKKIKSFVDNVRPFKEKIMFLSKSFNDIPLLTNTMYYIDPPYGYVKNNDTIGTKQISEAGYNAYYNRADDLMLYEYVKNIHKIGSSFMLSGLLEHNDKKSWILTRLINDGFNWKEIDLNYNKVSRLDKDKKSKEIIIYNYQI
jgi:DNA adenine methylase Dam